MAPAKGTPLLPLPPGYGSRTSPERIYLYVSNVLERREGETGRYKVWQCRHSGGWSGTAVLDLACNALQKLAKIVPEMCDHRSPPGEGRGEGKGKNRTETKKARALRRSATPAEQKLWLALRNGTLDGAKFRRQFPFGAYILDLAVVGARLVVEVDGESHYTGNGPARDAERDYWLKAQGWQVLRFTNPEVLTNLDGVLETIRSALRGFPHPNPLPQGYGSRTSPERIYLYVSNVLERREGETGRYKVWQCRHSGGWSGTAVLDLACNALQTLAKIVPEMCDHRSPQGEGADP